MPRGDSLAENSHLRRLQILADYGTVLIVVWEHEISGLDLKSKLQETEKCV